MASYSCRQKRVKVPIPVNQERFFVQSLNKGDKVQFPQGCAPIAEPVLLPDELFQRYEPMPTNFRKLPFAFSTPHHKQTDIQKILHFSFRQQKEEDVSYCPGFVCHVIKSCLFAIDVHCSLEMGFRKIERESGPHMWLDIDESKVDNTYEKHLSKEKINILEKSIPDCYQEGVFSYPTAEDMPIDKDEFAQICYNKNIEIFMMKPDKGVALGLNREELYLYYFAMVRFMWESFGVNISAIDPAVRHYCWNCGKFPAYSKMLLSDIMPAEAEEIETNSFESRRRFKHCSLCMVANYCSRKCQEEDWHYEHRFVCVSRVPGPSAD